MKKIVAAIMALAISTVLFAGCSRRSEESHMSSEPVADKVMSKIDEGVEDMSKAVESMTH